MTLPIFQFALHNAVPVPYRPSANVCVLWLPRGDESYGETMRRIGTVACKKGAPGIVCLEYDVAVSQELFDEIEYRVKSAEGDVIAAPYLLYPASTRLDHPVWAHRARNKEGKPRFVSSIDPCPQHPMYFGLGCTYLPKALLAAMPDDLRQWDYPRLDSLLSELAQEKGISCQATIERAIHLHY